MQQKAWLHFLRRIDYTPAAAGVLDGGKLKVLFLAATRRAFDSVGLRLVRKTSAANNQMTAIRGMTITQQKSS